MELMEAVKDRHSVRSYLNKKIDNTIVEKLNQQIKVCNQESGLHIQLVLEEPKAFSGFKAHYGKFSGVTNYLAVIGKKEKESEEKCGYYGEKIVLLAQQLGLNTCWVASTYDKIKGTYQIGENEKLYIVITIGYGTVKGKSHKSKPRESVTKVKQDAPVWFWNGVDAALLAPTAINQQKFQLIYDEGKVRAKAGIGVCTNIDLGIMKYHFEIGSGKDSSIWK